MLIRLALQVLTIISVFGLTPVAWADDLATIKANAKRNMAIVEKLAKSRLNCCDPRAEIACNEILQPKSKDGLAPEVMEFPGNYRAFVLPLTVTPGDEGKVLIKAAIWGVGGRPETSERSLKQTSEGLVWYGKTGKQERVEVSSTTLAKATNTRPLGSSGSTACYMQRAIPSTAEFAKDVKEVSCFYKWDPKEAAKKPEDFDFDNPPPNNTDFGKPVCFYPVSCKRLGDGILANMTETSVGCLPIGGRCPSADLCALDPAVTVDDTKILKVGDPVPVEKMSLEPLGEIKDSGAAK